MKHNGPGLGIDITEVPRFKRLLKARKHPFLKKVFSAQELSYARSRGEPAVHLAGFFAAKEASSKALGVARYPFIELEIRHDRNGAPEVWHKSRKLQMRVSISHTSSVAVAVALV